MTFGLVKATRPGRTSGHRECAVFYRRRRYTKLEGKGCTWQHTHRRDEEKPLTHASQARPFPRGPAHPTPFFSLSLSLRSIPAGRPSLRIRPAGRALAQNNRNCGEISVPFGPSLWTIVAFSRSRSRGCSAEAEHAIVRNIAEFSASLGSRSLPHIARGWFDFSAPFSISLHFNANRTRHQVSRCCSTFAFFPSSPLSLWRYRARRSARYRPWTFIYDARRIRYGTLG